MDIFGGIIIMERRGSDGSVIYVALGNIGKTNQGESALNTLASPQNEIDNFYFCYSLVVL